MKSILFLGKQDDAHGAKALNHLRDRFENIRPHLGKWGDPWPRGLEDWEGDYIISYLSRWIVPENLLRRAKGAALNFHPAPPEYPGFGCINFALYEQSRDYGVTCHHMARGVDTGPIVAVRRFPILETDSVATLLARTYDQQLSLFLEIADILTRGEPLPQASEHWTRKPFTRKQFNELNTITPQMSEEEIRRRVRATSFGSFQPEMKIAGYTFVLKPD